MKRGVIVTTILVNIFLFMTFGSVRAAGDFLGDFCWSVHPEDGSGVTVKLGVFHMGGGHYQLLGTAQTGTDGTYPAQGNAEIIEGKLHMSVIMGDGNNNAMTTLHGTAVLDPATLSGSYNMLHTGASKTGQSEIRYSTGTMTFIPCQ